ncbi:hypothetical protein M405DRAFT_935516 [Rhizopogon salebrosus TDB-379]|nr:hypothetical protein M405DRAFT_935516 [Rhizopogon salebrosus TDB-379]
MRLQQTEADEPGSVQYNYQVWRQQRNKQVISETQLRTIATEGQSWDRPVANLHRLRKRLNYFCNRNPKGTSITSLHIINQDVGGIIMTGAAVGIVRLYRNYDSTSEQGLLQIVSSFRALHEMIQVRRGSSLVLDWKQSSGTLLIDGDSRIIRV